MTVPSRDDGLPTIGLALIAKDEEKSLPTLLDSTLPHVDYAVLCDTGSTDETVKVFEGLLAKHGCAGHTTSFSWCQDFAAARQASFDALPDGIDFTVWADCDDEIVGGEKLRMLAANMPDNVAGLIFPYDYAHDPAGNCVCYLERERLVRRGVGERWMLPIHEVLRVPGQLVRSDAARWVHHRDPERNEPERNYRILKADLDRAEAENRTPDPRTLVYLGTESLALGRFEEAVGWLNRYLDVGTWDEERCQAAHKLSLAYRALDRLDDAEDAARRAVSYRPDFGDGYIDLAECALRRDQPDQALRFLEKARACGVPETLLIINPLDYTYSPLVMEAAAFAKLGRTEEAFDATQRALRVTPYREDLQAQAYNLAQELKAQETVKHVLALRELLVRHDENLKALRLLENAPYYVQDRPEVHQAKLDQREMVLHATDPDVYGSYYRDNPGEAPFEQHQIPIDRAHEYFARLGFLRRGLAEQRKLVGRPLRVLDLSGNDGWAAANLSLEGHRVDMMEMNPDAARRAEGRRKDFPGMGRVVCGDLHDAPHKFRTHAYDAVVCFETIEHVPDPQRLLDTMERMCRDGGRLYVSTPDGAYERGMDPVMARWHVVEMKGHLRAIPPSQLAGWGSERGVVRDLEVQQKVAAISIEPQERVGKVVFFAGAGFVEPLPEKILTEGLGGSETALCKMAEQFARKGYDVRVYAGSGPGGLRGDHVTVDSQDLTGQVLYAPASAWDPGEECDLFVCSRIPEVFDRSIAAPRRVLWLHDADYTGRLTAERSGRATDIVVMSEFQRELLTTAHPHIAGKVWVSRNGIEPLLYRTPPTRRLPWVAYTSSPDRGLDILLSVWPRIRERVPDAELHCAYAPVYYQVAKIDPQLGEFHSKVGKQLDQLGVVSHVSLNQREIAGLYQQARVWAYPSWNTPGGQPFPEISCISAMEAQAGGAVPVVLEFGALRETVVTGAQIPGDPTTKVWQDEFVDHVVRGLTDDEWQRACALTGRTFALGLGWEDVADAWEDRFLTRNQERLAA